MNSFIVTLLLLLQSTLQDAASIRQKTNKFKFTTEELLNTVFPHATSQDLYLDPCKAVSFEGDIALHDEDFFKIKNKTLDKVETYKQELLDGLQIEEEGMTDYLRKKLKHPSPGSTRSYNDLFEINKSEEIKFRHKKLDRLEKNFQDEKPVHEFEPSFDFKHKSKKVKRAATAKRERIWDYGVIPYEIDPKFGGAHRGLFKQAMRHWENFTCLKFVERVAGVHDNYILFTEKQCGCCSFVGKRGTGAQAISLGKNCDKFGIIIHELGHVVGFWHEHTRPDRDKFVNIFKSNILNGQDYNFNKLTPADVNSLGLTYDYDSIMHYARNTFSKGLYLDTIAPIEVPGKKTPEIGQRIRLSEGDIAQTNLLYNCPKCGRTFQESSGNFSSPKDSKTPLDCEWRISASHGENIILNIDELDIKLSKDCQTDYIEIRDGYWKFSPLLALICGNTKPKPIISKGNRMTVTYHSTNPQGYEGFKARYEVSCGGEIQIDSDIPLSSPNYPEEYLPNKECTWKISTQEGYKVAIKFHFFGIESHDSCTYDYIEIRDGLKPDSPILKLLCGYKLPEAVISSADSLLVKFSSDGSVQKEGFYATIMREYDECATEEHGCEHECKNTLGSYECVCRLGYELSSDGKRCEDTCGGEFTEPNGTVTSPMFPNTYMPNKKCVWEIRADPRYKVILNFTHFDIEGNNQQPQQCDYDRVEVYSVLSEDNVKNHGVFCGPRNPGIITSEGHIMRIVFQSDGNIQKSGFSLVYYMDIDECSVDNGGCEHDCHNTPGSFSCSCHNGYLLGEDGKSCREGGCKHEITAPVGKFGSPNYPDSYPPLKDCVWHFVTTPGHRLRISFFTFEVESHQNCAYDVVNFYDGGSSDAMSLGKFCGSKLPNLIVSSGNQLYMSFKSDQSIQRKGFWASHATVCGGMLEATFNKKHLYSHVKFGRAHYDNHADCDWTITAQSGYNVKLSFLTFNIEEEKDCGYDFVEVFNGLDSSSLSFGRFCGAKKPQDIISTQDALLVRFRTDDSLVSNGFSIMYEAVEYNFEEE